MKTCRVCNQAKLFTEFYALSRNKDGLDTRCKACVRVVQREVYHNTKDASKIKARNLMRRYGIDVDTYESMIAAGCAICGSTESLCIDHDHECCPGKETCGSCLRGVLCWTHNLAEAAFKDVEQIKRLLEYREKYG